MSLRGRLTLLLLGGSGAILIAAGVTLRLLTGSWLEREFDLALESKARALVTLTKQNATGIELDFADEYMPTFERPIEPEYFQLWRGDGIVIERSRSLSVADLPRSAATTRAQFRDVVLPDGRGGRLVQVDFVPQIADDDKGDVDIELDRRSLDASSDVWAATIVMAQGRKALEARLRQLDIALTIIWLVLLVANASLVWVALGIGLRPLARMARQVRLLDADTLDTRLTMSSSPRELAPVVEQLNLLLDRLEAAFERERRLSSNLAHELRTPIAELQNLAEVASEWPADTEMVRRYFGDVRAISEQMQRIVVHLLELARSESNRVAVETSRFAIRDLIDHAQRTVAREATAKGVVLEVAVPPDLIVASDRTKLGLMLSNILSNAVRHGCEGGTVTISATAAKDDRITVMVANRTDALEQKHLPLLFDRFWRQDAARTSGLNAGLGLTLVRAFADSLGVSLAVELAPDGLFRLSLELPGICADDPARA